MRNTGLPRVPGPGRLIAETTTRHGPKPKKAFRGSKMSISAPEPERSFRGPNNAISSYVQSLALAAYRNLKPLVHWGVYCAPQIPWWEEGLLRLPQVKRLSIFGLSFLALRSSSADRRPRRIMQKSLKALRGTEYCRNIWDTGSWRCTSGQKWRKKLKIMWCCGVMLTAIYVLQGIKGKGEERKKTVSPQSKSV